MRYGQQINDAHAAIEEQTLIIDELFMEGRFCTCDQYEISPPTLTTLRVCGNLTTCGPNNVRQITSPTPTTDRVCRAENVTTTIQSDVPSAQLSLFTAINNWIVISPAYPASTPAQTNFQLDWLLYVQTFSMNNNANVTAVVFPRLLECRGVSVLLGDMA